MKNNITIIGFGKVGSAFAFAVQNSGYRVKYVIDKNARLLQRYKKHFTDCNFEENITSLSLKESDIIIISVRDNQVQDVVREIKNVKTDLRNKYIFHTSGALTSDVFESIKSKEVQTGSMHPVQTFNKLYVKGDNLLKGIYFGIEGDYESLKLFRRLCKKLGSNYLEIKKHHKILYHIACVISSNFLVTNLFILEEIFGKIGNKNVMKVFKPIIIKTLENAEQYGISKALTGPISRNDLNTIENHLNQLKGKYPDILHYYVMLSKNALKIAGGDMILKKHQSKKLNNLLNKYSNKI